MRKALGWLLFVLCCVSFFVVLVIPFMAFSHAEKASYMAGAYIFSQITWWLCLPLLGKEFIAWTKSLWQTVRDVMRSKVIEDDDHV